MKRLDHWTHTLLLSALLTSCASAPSGDRTLASNDDMQWLPTNCAGSERMDECLVAEKRRLELVGQYLRYIRLHHGDILVNSTVESLSRYSPKQIPKSEAWRSFGKTAGALMFGGAGSYGIFASYKSLVAEPSSQGTSFTMFGGPAMRPYAIGGGLLYGTRLGDKSVQSFDGIAAKNVGSLNLGTTFAAGITISVVGGMSGLASYMSFGEMDSTEAEVALRSVMRERLSAISGSIATGLGLGAERSSKISTVIENDILSALDLHIAQGAKTRGVKRADLADKDLKEILSNFKYNNNILEMLAKKGAISSAEYRSYVLANAILTNGEPDVSGADPRYQAAESIRRLMDSLYDLHRLESKKTKPDPARLQEIDRLIEDARNLSLRMKF